MAKAKKVAKKAPAKKAVSKKQPKKEVIKEPKKQAPPPLPTSSKARIPAPWESGDDQPQASASPAPTPPAPPAPPVQHEQHPQQGYYQSSAVPPPPPPPPPPAPTSAHETDAPVFAHKATLRKLVDWDKLRKKIEKTCKPLVEEEMAMRKELAAVLFPNASEGTNTLDIPDGWKVKLVQPVERKLDEASMAATFSMLPAGWQDHLVRYKPYLNLENWRQANPEVRAFIEANCLTTKPGSITLELIPPTKD